MYVSAGGSWEMLVGRRDSQLNYSSYCLFPPTLQYSGFIWRLVLCPWGMQVPGGKADAGLPSKAGAWLEGCMGTVGPADLKVTLVVIAIGLWQGF